MIFKGEVYETLTDALHQHDLVKVRFEGGADFWFRPDPTEAESFKSCMDVSMLLLPDMGVELMMARAQKPTTQREPIPMILHCPRCHRQHVDAPSAPTFMGYEITQSQHDALFEIMTKIGLSVSDPVYRIRDRWENPPHKSHLCAYCECVWRPADVETVGVSFTHTKGSADNWIP